MKNKQTKPFRHLVDGTSLRSKLLWGYFWLLIIPLGLFTIYAFYRIGGLTRTQTFTAAWRTFEDSQKALEDDFKRLDDVLRILSMDPSVYQVCADPEEESYLQRLKASDHVSTTLNHLRSLSGTDRIQIYTRNETAYTDPDKLIFLSPEIMQSAWYQTLNPRISSAWFSPVDFSDQIETEQSWFSAVRIIYNLSHLEEPLAILRADLSENRILEDINSANITPNGFFLLLRGGQVLQASSHQKSDTDLLASIPDSDTDDWISVSTKEGQYFLQCRSLSCCGWRLAMVLPHEDVFQLSKELGLEMFSAVMAVGIVAYLLAVSISRSALKRLSLLTDTMRAVENGDVTARVHPIGQDEIGQLMGSFERMMNQIDVLMEEKVEYGRQIKNLELKALQAQINPHFLYNSLDLINCTAMLHHVPEITELVHALAKFYKLSLSRGREVIRLAEEFSHARLYIKIQNMRFENRIHTEWDIPDEILEYRIIKIVLQPLLENAVIHGLFEKPEKTGTIRICARQSANRILITVSDDGVGMDEATLQENFCTVPGGIQETGGGYGVRNINDRLHLAYGEEYGLFCTSTPGIGTTVTIAIPPVESESDRKE